jgi:O-acetyl-ADP-ribose deacetylase (regulator of RNase III)
MGNKQSGAAAGSEHDDVGEAEDPTENRPKTVQETLKEQKEFIDRAIDEKTKAVQASLRESKANIDRAFEEKTKAIQASLRESKETIDRTIEEKTKAMQASLRESKANIDRTIDEQTKAVQNLLGLNKTVAVHIDPAVEDRDPNLARSVSSLCTNADYSRNVAGLKLLPAGSAFYTSSGSLANYGITGVIHAATGSSSRDGKGLSPTLQSVANSVRNCLILAARREHKKIAIPFIGGALFLNRIATTPEILAATIVRSALEHKGDLVVALVPFGPQDTWLFQQTLDKLLAEEQYAASRDGSIEVCPGDITKSTVHGADVIVNAANTEARFGGGVSGAIARATGCQQAIDREAGKIVNAFISEFINQH